MEMGADLLAVGPSHLGEGLFQRTAFLLIEFLESEIEIAHDIRIRKGDSRRLDRFVAPLHQAAAVGEAALLFD